MHGVGKVIGKHPRNEDTVDGYIGQNSVNEELKFGKPKANLEKRDGTETLGESYFIDL